MKRSTKRKIRKVCTIVGWSMLIAGSVSLIYALAKESTDILGAVETYKYAFGGIVGIFWGMAFIDEGQEPVSEWKPRYVKR